MKKMLFLVVLVALAAGGYFWWRSSQVAKPKTDDKRPKTVLVKRGSIRLVVETTGRVVANQEVEIKCKASGEVTKLPVDVSDPVKKRDLLVQLDPENEERSVKRSQVSLAVSEARLAQARLQLQIAQRDLSTEGTRAEAALVSVEARVQEAKAKLERVEQLLAKKMASREESDAAKTAKAQAVADLESARARIEDLNTRAKSIELEKQSVKIAEAQVEGDRLSLSDARQRLDDTTVLSPIDGMVASRPVQIGQIIASGINNVGGGTTVLTIVDLSRIFILANVDESDIGRVESGQSVQVTVDAHPEARFPGEVVRVATKGAVVSNVVTFEVKVEVRGRRRSLLKPEMTANVEIVAVDKQDVLLVPVGAVKRRRRDRFVTVQKPDNTTEERMVEVGVSNGEEIEVIEGLSEGETVLMSKGGSASRWRKDDDAARKQRRESRMGMRVMGGGRRR